MPEQEPIQAEQGGNFLTKKLGPLPVWGWAAAGIGAYLLYRHYTGGGSLLGSGANDSGAGNSSGGQGTIQTGGGSQTGSNQAMCRTLTDPLGHKHHVCGHGHWVKGPFGAYSWVQGVLHTPKGKDNGSHGGGGSKQGTPGQPPPHKGPVRKPAAKAGR